MRYVLSFTFRDSKDKRVYHSCTLHGNISEAASAFKTMISKGDLRWARLEMTTDGGDLWHHEEWRLEDAWETETPDGTGGTR